MHAKWPYRLKLQWFVITLYYHSPVPFCCLTTCGPCLGVVVAVMDTRGCSLTSAWRLLVGSRTMFEGRDRDHGRWIQGEGQKKQEMLTWSQRLATRVMTWSVGAQLLGSMCTTHIKPSLIIFINTVTTRAALLWLCGYCLQLYSSLCLLLFCMHNTQQNKTLATSLSQWQLNTPITKKQGWDLFRHILVSEILSSMHKLLAWTWEEGILNFTVLPVIFFWQPNLSITHQLFRGYGICHCLWWSHEDTGCIPVRNTTAVDATIQILSTWPRYAMLPPPPPAIPTCSVRYFDKGKCGT